MDDDERIPANYWRRRADQATDRRMASVESKVDELDRKVDALSARLAILAGALGILSLAANILGPLIAREIFK